jgi:hypothetical protein
MERSAAEAGAERRWDAATGIIAAVLLVVSLALPGAPPKADDSLSQISSFFSDQRDQIVGGDFLLGLGIAFFIWFLAALRSRLRAAEGGESGLSTAALAGALVGIALLMAGVAVVNALAFRATGGADPNVVRLLFDLSNSLFAMVSFPMAVFAAAASISAARTGALPTWLAWVGLLVAVLQLLGGLSLIATHGFFQAGGAFGFIGPLSLLVWIVLLSVVLMRRPAAAAA